MSLRTTLALGFALSGSLFAQNNDCSGSITLLPGTNGPFSNVGSTTSAPSWGCGAGANDVWFDFSASGVGTVTIDTCGASFDTVLQVFTGNCGASLVSIGCNDDACGTASSLTLSVTPWVIYRVRVGGFQGATGTFPLHLQGAVAGSVYASNTSRGRGCQRDPASFYETFGGPVDLSNTSLTMTPASGGFTVAQSNTAFLPPSAAASVLPLSDDSEATVLLPVPMPIPGGTTTALTVASNGSVAAGLGNSTSVYDSYGLLNNPATAWYAHADYDPAEPAGGRVKFEMVGSKACVTWDGVWAYIPNLPSSARTFQFQFDTSNGNVHLVFQNMSTQNWLLVGYSPGGPSYDGGAIDISAAAATSFTLPAVDGLPLTVTPTTRPIYGTGWSMDVTQFPATSTLGVDILGFTDPGIDDLTSIGMPTCGLRASLESVTLWTPFGTTHNYTIAIPNSPAVVGLHLYTTSAVFVPGCNTFGAITGNGIDGQIGDY
ncbi:MAG: hypothetical protein JNK15_18645 [Planctomycetes bacterium]|nr:hypothetical protein [Planctomycetota bacterium]